MLSSTADHLFWMARYMERAENTARLLDVNYQTALLPQSPQAALQGWTNLLISDTETQRKNRTRSCSDKFPKTTSKAFLQTTQKFFLRHGEHFLCLLLRQSPYQRTTILAIWG